MMEELTLRQETTAPVGALKRAIADVGSLPAPSLRLTWRGRAGVRALDGKLTAEVALDAAGRNGVACRYRFGGLFARLITRDGHDQLKGNLQYIAAVICHRAEELHAASSDGRPPPARKAGRPSDLSANGDRGTAARPAPVARTVTTVGAAYGPAPRAGSLSAPLSSLHDVARRRQ